MDASKNHSLKFYDILILASYCAYIFWLSAQSSLEPPIDLGITMQDKFYHAGAYSIMSLLAWRCFRHFVPQTNLIIISIIFCSIYGMSDEWHQSFVMWRTPDVLDWLADITGASIALFFQQQFFSENKQTINEST